MFSVTEFITHDLDSTGSHVRASVLSPAHTRASKQVSLAQYPHTRVSQHPQPTVCPALFVPFQENLAFPRSWPLCQIQ